MPKYKVTYQIGPSTGTVHVFASDRAQYNDLVKLARKKVIKAKTPMVGEQKWSVVRVWFD